MERKRKKNRNGKWNMKWMKMKMNIKGRKNVMRKMVMDRKIMRK